MNWKTTVFGAAAFILPAINLLLPMIPPPYGAIVTAVLGAVAFYHAKDKDVTGGTRQQ